MAKIREELLLRVFTLYVPSARFYFNVDVRHACLMYRRKASFALRLCVPVRNNLEAESV